MKIFDPVMRFSRLPARDLLYIQSQFRSYQCAAFAATRFATNGFRLVDPFGTIAYLIIFGNFDRSGAAIALSLIMTLKLFFAGCLVLAHQRFLQNRGLVVLILTSLLATLIIGFLHGLVPAFLVSITDAIAAIVVGILALVWAIWFLLRSIPAVAKAVV